MLHRRTVLGLLASTLVPASALAQSKEPVLIGVSGPLTGQYAQYGAQWKKGFDLALDEINASGGINGRPLQYVFEDTQSDPRQTVTVARKYVADERIAVEVGDFSSAASMAASPIYQAAQMVQFGFTNSHPDFTKGGDYVWSNAVNQKDEMPLLADFAARPRAEEDRRPCISTAIGAAPAKDLLVEAVKQRGGEIIGAEGYLRRREGLPLRHRAAARRQSGFHRADLLLSGRRAAHAPDPPGRHTQPIVAGGSIYSPKFLELGGNEVNGVLTTVPFFPGRSAPGGAGVREEFRGEVRRAARRL